MVEQIGPHTTIVSALPRYKDLHTGETWVDFDLPAPRRWSSGEYLRRQLWRGNELGRPSYTLYRSDVLDRSAELWITERSCDLVVNVLAAFRGEAVLLPPGPVIAGIHRRSDTSASSLELALLRLRNTTEYLRASADARVRRVADAVALGNGLFHLGAVLAQLALGRAVYRGCLRDLMRILGQAARARALRDLPSILTMLRLRWARRGGRRVAGPGGPARPGGTGPGGRSR